jgi:hypothetical protein
MAKPDALKRLGGGRWETKDGRFQIEPQSGTWVIVDTTQTNEFGLPLVRGPFGSLTAAREAIEGARDEGPVESPLADRIEHARHPAREETKAAATGASVKAAGSKKAGAREAAPEPEPEEEPQPPPDPRWIRELGATDRRKAKALIERLDDLGIDGAEEIARGEIAKREPALAQAALERQLRAATRTAKTPQAAVKAALKIILAGSDDKLEAEWKLVDSQGRPIDTIDLVD